MTSYRKNAFDGRDAEIKELRTENERLRKLVSIKEKIGNLPWEDIVISLLVVGLIGFLGWSGHQMWSSTKQRIRATEQARIYYQARIAPTPLRHMYCTPDGKSNGNCELVAGDQTYHLDCDDDILWLNDGCEEPRSQRANSNGNQ